MGRILVGTAGWTDRTLVASGWYPSGVNSAADRLAYYADRFPLVEVDATYYAPPAEQTARLWAQRTPAEFTFNVKAFSLLTRHPTRPAAIFKDLRPETDKANVYLGDIDPEVLGEIWDRFLAALLPLWDAGKLGTLLFQFPPWFVIGRRNKEYILDCQRRCAPMRICVEFRSDTWMSERNRTETLDFLRANGIPYVCVDMPQGYRNSVPPIVAATAELAVVRFHGHSDRWTSKIVHERFGYRYSEAELGEWASTVRSLAGEAESTHLIMNNCYSDYAHVNAKQLMDLVDAAD